MQRSVTTEAQLPEGSDQVLRRRFLTYRHEATGMRCS
jgi:hypothetical protein